MSNQMTFIDYFAGIGGFTEGLKQAGMRCVGFCEADKWAIKSYTAMHEPSRKEWFCGDITTAKSSEIPYADGWTAGFPCQDVSVCGKMEGLSGARSGLFFEFIRLLKGKSPETRPRWILLENVKNLISVNGGRDFAEVLYQISEVGYDCEWEVVNSKHFGVPQNRERVFIIGHLRTGSPREVFPVTGAVGEATGELVEVISGRQGNRVYCSQGISICLTSQAGGFAGKTGAYCIGNSDGQCFVDLCIGNPQKTDIARCIKARYNSGISKRTELSGVLTTSGRIRRLTPRECFRLQGFSDEMLEKAQAVNSDNQLYRQAGNSVTVPVIKAIGEGLVRAYET